MLAPVLHEVLEVLQVCEVFKPTMPIVIQEQGLSVIIVKELDTQRIDATSSMDILADQMPIQDLTISFTITIHQGVNTTRIKTLILPSIKDTKVKVLQQMFMEIC